MVEKRLPTNSGLRKRAGERSQVGNKGGERNLGKGKKAVSLSFETWVPSFLLEQPKRKGTEKGVSWE